MLASLALLPSCGGPEGPPRNLLLVTIDTLRADRLGAYGFEGAGTDTLDRLAEEGALFSDASATTPITLPSHASIFTGQDPMRHGARHNGLFSVSPEATTLAEILRERGYQTGGFVGSLVLSAEYGLAQGFDAYTDPRSGGRTEGWVTERSAARVNADALGWCSRLDRERPWFLWVHYMEPHAPYNPPEPERSRFPTDPYQGEVAAADRALGELLSRMQSAGLLSDTLVVVTADHGEGLGEHGEKTHGFFLYQATIHVPLLFRGPGVPRGRSFPEPVSILDVLPTALEALGVSSPGQLQGVSLWGALQRGEPLDDRRDLYLESMFTYYGYGGGELRGLREGPWKLIRDSRERLFDLRQDAGEARNLAGREPTLKSRLAGVLDSTVSSGEAAGSSRGPRTLAPGEEEAFRSLGYIGNSGNTATGERRRDPEAVMQDSVDLARAGYLQQQGQLQEAEQAFRELMAKRPLWIDVRALLIQLLAGQGRLTEALEESREMEEAASSIDGGLLVASGAHGRLASALAAKGDLNTAAEMFDLAMRIPQPPELAAQAAAVYYQLGREEDAVRILENLKASQADTEESRRMLSYIESRRAGTP